MKIKQIAIVVIITFTCAISCSNEKTSGKKDNTKLETKTDSLSYALGSLIGREYKRGGFKELNYDILVDVLRRALNGDSLMMNERQSTMILQSFALAEMKKKSDDFLAENKTKAGIVTTVSGLQYKIINVGKGSKPVIGQKVKVNYTAKLMDGKVFDSSEGTGQPAVFGIEEVIPGWTEALQLMTEGSKWELYISPALGYGEKGKRGVPGNSVIIVEVELLDIIVK